MKIKYYPQAKNSILYQVDGDNSYWFSPVFKQYSTRVAGNEFTPHDSLTIPEWAEPLAHKAIDKANRFFTDKS